MTIGEFKAWLGGFGESIKDAPTPEQWAKIKAMIDGLQWISSPPQPIYRVGDPLPTFPIWPHTTCSQVSMMGGCGGEVGKGAI